ncbi:Adenylyl-sulfate kinase 1, chloroplastic [Vitis vinifera]|uniref:Adenylyl-sulfate kinase n=1 Tax=Vitis vinifera TaxID=29760 RepID=A0A438KQ31_VITVI|nr:Adenylyl-sulfate kinase 1, chloroplastic [Vitis vinifera]
MAVIGAAPWRFCSFSDSKLGFSDSLSSPSAKFVRWNAVRFDAVKARSRHVTPIKAVKAFVSGQADGAGGKNGMSTNIVWHECSVDKLERQRLLQQKGCVIWITGLSGSERCFDRPDGQTWETEMKDERDGEITRGKSTLACALSRALHSRGNLTYVLDGDNVRHGLNRDLSFRAEDRAENIRRIGEVAKLFSDSGIICIASLISPYRKDRDACRAMLSEGNFIEVFMDIPLEVCEERDPKGLYKLARAGKIRGFTGIDDPYEPPLNCEVVLQQTGGDYASPSDMAKTVISYLEEKGYLKA